MKIVQINTVPNGSTGTIMMNIHKELLKQGNESYVVWGRGRKSNNEHEIFMNDKIGVYFHVLYSRLTGKTGFASKRATKKLLEKFDEIKPDIIHLHNIHGYYINIEMLFKYIKEKNIRIIWTLHDCWAFTGHCVHFENVQCTKWKKKCNKCVQLNKYPKAFLDKSNWCFEKKKRIFTSIDNCTIITPSKWLSNLVKQSFLKKYEIKVINNGIDTKVFRVINKEKLQFRKNYNLEDKKIILGVASVWTNEKGLDDFIELSKTLGNSYKIVMVGLNKKQLKSIPKNIIGIERTESLEDLVDIYNSADVYLNPTYEDNYPTTNLEAKACRLQVITYNTGGSPETIEDKENIIDKGNIEKLIKTIKACETNNINSPKKIYNKNDMINKYLEVYCN